MDLFTTFKRTLSIVIFGGTWLVPGFGWNITSVFFRLIMSPNRQAALAKESVILFILLIECALSAQSLLSMTNSCRLSMRDVKCACCRGYPLPLCHFCQTKLFPRFCTTSLPARLYVEAHLASYHSVIRPAVCLKHGPCLFTSWMSRCLIIM